MKRPLTALGAIALAVATSTLALGGLAEAGGPIPRAAFTIVVDGVDADTVRNGLTPELYSDEGGLNAVDLSGCDFFADAEDNFDDGEFGEFEAERIQGCGTLPPGTYYLGMGGTVPPEFGVGFSCTVTGIGEIAAVDREILLNEQGQPAVFTLDADDRVSCIIRVRAGIVAIDKIVTGGPSDSSDFTINVLNDQDAVVSSGVDPANDLCSSQLIECALVNVNTQEHGTELSLDEAPEWGYVLDGISCDSYVNLEGKDFFLQFSADSTDGTFSLGDGDAYCRVTNRYATGTLDVSAVVINDNGGTATAPDVSFEVFRADSTPEIAATACMADGSCYDGPLAIGDYIMGYVGPAGYTVDITQTVIPPVLPMEMITDDPEADFTMEEGARVEIVITINDPVPATTTTTTTTVAPTTTVAATTTTALDASGVTLPGTGTSSEANGWMATLALLFVASGGALLIARRRAS